MTNIKDKDYPTVLELAKRLEEEAVLYRKGLDIPEDTSELDIKDCLRWLQNIVDDFEARLSNWE